MTHTTSDFALSIPIAYLETTIPEGNDQRVSRVAPAQAEFPAEI